MRSLKLGAWVLFLAVWPSAAVRDYQVPSLAPDDDVVPSFDVDDDAVLVFDAEHEVPSMDHKDAVTQHEVMSFDEDDDVVPIFDADDDDAPVLVLPEEQEEPASWSRTSEVDSDFAALPEMPTDCSSGKLHLNGTYKVGEGEVEIKVPGEDPCHVISDSAQLLLKGHIWLRGAVRFSGHLKVIAQQPLDYPCLSLNEGVLEEGALLHIQDCNNAMQRGSAGGLYVWKSLDLQGELQLHNCHARRSSLGGGGLYVSGKLQIRGLVNITDCSTDGDGGAIYTHEYIQAGGTLSISASTADKGGGIYADHFIHSGGNLRIRGSATSQGGGIFAVRLFNSSGGDLIVHDSHAQADGGGIYANESFVHSSGRVSISGCTAAKDGGGLYVYKWLNQSGGNLSIGGSKAAGNGGGLSVFNWLYQSGGDLSIDGSEAGKNGGAISAESDAGISISGGTLSISRSKAGMNGGGISSTILEQLGGNMSISGCEAHGLGGGAMYAMRNLTMLNASLKIDNCVAGKIGGGISAPRLAHIQESDVVISSCRCRRNGGGIRAEELLLSHSSVALLNMSAERGAAIHVWVLNQTGGKMEIDNSSASAGVLMTSTWEINNGSMEVQRSSSPGTALLLALASGHFWSSEILVTDCPLASSTFYLGKDAAVSNAVFNNCASPQLRAEAVDARNITITGSEGSIQSRSVTFERVECDREYGGIRDGRGVHCRICPPLWVFWKNTTEVTLPNHSAIQKCVQCPDPVGSCGKSRIEMERGLMVDLGDISRAFSCPNALACPGSVLSDVEGEKNRKMCAEGYTGLGCNTCADHYAPSDSNIFICYRCANSTMGKLKHAFMFLAGDVTVFILFWAGVMGSQDRKKNSAVYLNQLMSFSAVAVPALMALKQTKALSQLLESFWGLLELIAVPVEVGDSGDSSMAVSAECLLQYMDLQPSPLLADCLSTGVNVVLGLLLARASGIRVAAVVTVNCFLAKFCSAFGKYLIWYRMEPTGKAIHFLQPMSYFPGILIPIAAILLCFAVGPGAWLHMIRDEKRKDEPHVLYLTGSYKRGYERWEVERLVRKMLLKLSSTSLPITLNPMCQMVTVNFVLMASLVLHMSNRPYVEAVWNNMEAGLLTAALCIVALTTLTLANEIHWAHTDTFQLFLIFATLQIISIAGGLALGLLGRKLFLERFKRLSVEAPKSDTEGEATPSADAPS